ncbi:MAG: hypothetical protein CMO44_12300, partial [Verrucomicrobiales bacterium]|nr:hypothetical protein [Verrucomicrobiales bacterium]
DGAEAAETAATYYEDAGKDVQVKDAGACPLGAGAQIHAKGEDPHNLAGVYDRKADAATFLQVGGSARIVFHKSGCGWAVEAAEAEAEQRFCSDSPAALAAAFGVSEVDCGPAEQTNGGYCTHPLFAAMCPKTCNACESPAESSESADYPSAIPVLAELLGVEKSSCNELKAWCHYAVVSTACAATCATNKRPSRGKVPADFALRFRASLRQREIKKASHASYVEKYLTFKMTPELDSDACAETPDTLPLNGRLHIEEGLPLYDVRGVESEALELKGICKGSALERRLSFVHDEDAKTMTASVLSWDNFLDELNYLYDKSGNRPYWPYTPMEQPSTSPPTQGYTDYGYGMTDPIFFRQSGIPNGISVLHNDAWLGHAPDFTDASNLNGDGLSNLFPKVLFTAYRTQAFLRANKMLYGKEYYRPVPSSTRVRITQIPVETDSIVLTLSGSELEWQDFNLNSEYAALPGTNIITDVVRIEPFSGSYAGAEAPLSGNAPFTFEMFIPGMEAFAEQNQWIPTEENPLPFTVLRYPLGCSFPTESFAPELTCGPPQAVKVTPAINQPSEDWYSITVPASLASGDFLAVLDINECAQKDLNHCEHRRDGGKCVNEMGSYRCECILGYVGQAGTPALTKLGPDEQCVVKKYSPPTWGFLIYHEDDAEFGVEINEVNTFSGVTEDNKHCLEATKNVKTVHKNISTSEFFPNRGGALLFDDNMGTSFKSIKLAASRDDGTGVWFFFEVEPTVTVNCIRVKISCTHEQPHVFTAHKGKTGSGTFLGEGPLYSEAFGMRGLPFNKAGMPGWLATARAHDEINTDGDGAGVMIDLPLTCGIANAQYFGEILLEYVTQTVCECEQLCYDHVDEGCTTYKWYAETKHCFLQGDRFDGADAASVVAEGKALATARATLRGQYTKGSGWWKRNFATGWPGWYTGEVGPLPLAFETTPETVVVGEPFTLSVLGVGLPFDEEVQEDHGSRQRIKLVKSHQTCVDLPPETVSGLDCTNSFTCTPRPKSYKRTFATWDKISLAGSNEMDTEYKVCYCGGECWYEQSWQEVPGFIKPEQIAYAWTLPNSVDQKVNRQDGATGFDLHVMRAAFADYSNPNYWSITVVKSELDCSVPLEDESLTSTKFTSLVTPDTVGWTIQGDNIPAGNYVVCLRTEPGAAAVGIPSSTTINGRSRYLTISPLDTDSSHPRSPFHFQTMSAKAGTKAKITVQGYRMHQPNYYSLALTITDSCSSDFDGVSSAQGSWSNFGVAAVLAPVPSESTADAYVFAGDVPAWGDGTFTACLCDATKKFDGTDTSDVQVSGSPESNLATTPTGTSQYAVKEDHKGAHASGSTWSGWNQDAWGSAQLCTSKCYAGCVGSDCHCEGMLSTDYDTYGDGIDGPRCLTASGCRDLCDTMGSVCAGYSMHHTLPRCWLHESGSGEAVDVNFDFWKKTEGNPYCTMLTDFIADETQPELAAKRNIGKVTITQKTDVGVDYIVTPGKPASIEVTGTGMSVGSDRVMVIDCTGTCGTAGPAASVTQPMTPVNAFVDRPALPAGTEYDYIPPVSFRRHEQQYCAGSAVPIAPRSLADHHRCYKKCFADPDGDLTFCNGFMNGLDTPESSSLCLDEDQCTMLCALTPECHSVDMHRGLNRCFLNTIEGCDPIVTAAQTTHDSNYDLLIKHADDNKRRLREQGRSLRGAEVRQLLAGSDPGISRENLLRFDGVHFAQGGEFKLCFCDSSHLGTNEVCKDPTDFAVEIGKVHATGLECLLKNPKMTRGTCVDQLYGGLRCYDGEVPATPVPEGFIAVPPKSVDDLTPAEQMLLGFCQYAPAEHTQEYEWFCAQHRAFPVSTITASAAP